MESTYMKALRSFPLTATCVKRRL